MGCAYLILENGDVFKGRPFGFDGEAVGELVFSTGMSGYLETLSDPSYFGQIVLQTFPLIGNYGVIPQDFGPGPVHLSAYIVREWCQEPSNFRSEGNLDSFLRLNRVPGLFDVDTRRLTSLIRDKGVMNAMISREPVLSQEQLTTLKGFRVTGAVEGVVRKNSEFGIRNSELRDGGASGRNSEFGIRNSELPVVIWDFGGGFRLGELLSCRSCAPLVVGFDASADDIMAIGASGVVLSGGPGDPAENKRIIGEIGKLCDMGLPIFAVGLGHQMLALALGGRTLKLPFGHRGINQPVLHRETGHAFITTQNHGYAVALDALPSGAVVSYENLNDGTCEGIDYPGLKTFSVQFDPTVEVIDRFVRCLNAAE